MPTSAAAALVLLLALVPGACGVYVFTQTVSADWRQKEWQAAVQHVAFSVLGLLVYAVAAAWLGFLPAAHVIPSTYVSIKASQLLLVLIPFTGHLACSALVGFSAAKVHARVAHASGASKHPSAWSEFVSSCVPERWIVVTLTTGDVWAGILAFADTGVQDSERDLILREPALLDGATGNYTASNYAALHIPARIVQSVGAVANADDARIGPAVGKSLFAKESPSVEGGLSDSHNAAVRSPGTA